MPSLGVLAGKQLSIQLGALLGSLLPPLPQKTHDQILTGDTTEVYTLADPMIDKGLCPLPLPVGLKIGGKDSFSFAQTSQCSEINNTSDW